MASKAVCATDRSRVRVSDLLAAVTQSYCPYCRRAKETLANEGAKCDIVELDLRDDGMALQGTIAKMTGRRTVPQVGGSAFALTTRAQHHPAGLAARDGLPDGKRSLGCCLPDN